MDRHEQIHKSRTEIFINNFLGGVAWGLGATLGISIILAITAFLLSRVNFIPFVGDFISKILNYVLVSNPNLLLK